MSEINIAFGVTQDWLKYTIITICSILSNADANDDYVFYIMSDNFSENDIKNFYKLDKIKKSEYNFVKMNNSDFEGVVHDSLGVSASYRLKLPSILNKDKVLYLDSDIISVKDINNLYSFNISRYFLAAVEDKLSAIMTERVGFSFPHKKYIYINSGVLLMNLKKFREYNLESIMFKRLKQMNYFTDQDVLNDVCKENILSLSLRYNLMLADENIYINDQKNFNKILYVNRKDEFREILNNPTIIHYSKKPWNDSSVPFSKVWFYYKEKYDNL